jgi:hypothetical protein
MSSTRQAVILLPSLIGCGNRFDLTPAHQVLFDTGIGPYGAMMFLNLMNPVSGRQIFVVGDFDWLIAPSAGNTFIGFSLLRHQSRSVQNLFSSCIVPNGPAYCCWMFSRLGRMFTISFNHKHRLPGEMRRASSSFCLVTSTFICFPPRSKVFLSCYRENAIAEPTMDECCSARCFLRSTTMDWRTLGAGPSIPNDLQFSRGCFDGSPGAALGIGPGEQPTDPNYLNRLPPGASPLREHSLLGFWVTSNYCNAK